MRWSSRRGDPQIGLSLVHHSGGLNYTYLRIPTLSNPVVYLDIITLSRDLSARGCQGKVAGTQCRWMIDLYRRCGEKVSTMTKSGQTEGGSRDASLGVCHLCCWTGPVTRINWRQRKYLKVRRLTRNICSECMELLVNGTSRHKRVTYSRAVAFDLRETETWPSLR